MHQKLVTKLSHSIIGRLEYFITNLTLFDARTVDINVLNRFESS